MSRPLCAACAAVAAMPLHPCRPLPGLDHHQGEESARMVAEIHGCMIRGLAGSYLMAVASVANRRGRGRPSAIAVPSFAPSPTQGAVSAAARQGLRRHPAPGYLQVAHPSAPTPDGGVQRHVGFVDMFVGADRVGWLREKLAALDAL